MEQVVYQHIRGDNGSPFYIGIGDKHRPYEKYGRNKYWHNIVSKHGYTVQVLVDNLSVEESKSWECYLIDTIGRKDLGKGPLVNVTNGGDGTSGYKHTESTRSKISNAHMGKSLSDQTKSKLSDINTGKKHSEETRAKMSLSRTNKKHSQDSILKMKTIHSNRPIEWRIKNAQAKMKPILDTNTGIFYTCAEIASILNVPIKTVYQGISKGYKKYSKYKDV